MGFLTRKSHLPTNKFPLIFGLFDLRFFIMEDIYKFRMGPLWSAWVAMVTFAVILAPLSSFAQRSRTPIATNSVSTTTNSTVSVISKTQIRR